MVRACTDRGHARCTGEVKAHRCTGAPAIEFLNQFPAHVDKALQQAGVASCPVLPVLPQPTTLLLLLVGRAGCLCCTRRGAGDRRKRKHKPSLASCMGLAGHEAGSSRHNPWRYIASGRRSPPMDLRSMTRCCERNEQAKKARQRESMPRDHLQPLSFPSVSEHPHCSSNDAEGLSVLRNQRLHNLSSTSLLSRARAPVRRLSQHKGSIEIGLRLHKGI